MLQCFAQADCLPRASLHILERSCALSCYKLASGNNCCSRTHAHAAAQDTSVMHKAWASASHATTTCGDIHDNIQLSLCQPLASREGQDCLQQSAVQEKQQNAACGQQQHHTQKQPLFWTVLFSYSNFTKLLAALSVIPALLLAVDPMVTVLGGNPATTPLAAASAWQGPLRDLFSFTVLLSVFITCEPGAAAASAVSAAGAALQLLCGPALPPLVACCAATALVAAVTMVLLAAACTKARSNTLDRMSSSSSMDSKLRLAGALQAMQQVLGVLGGGLLAQFLTTLLPSASRPAGAAGIVWLLPVVTGAVAVLLAGKLVAASKNKRLLQLWTDWPAWSATLLLILQPLQQLVELSLQPLHVQHSISAGQQVLLVLASGLMVPRALLQRELMWFTGTFCGASLSAGQLALCATQHMTQGWASAAGLAGASRGASVMVTIGALLLLCELLQAGWQHVQAPTADDNTTKDLPWDVERIIILSHPLSPLRENRDNK